LFLPHGEDILKFPEKIILRISECERVAAHNSALER
jgi:hypothetical protein